jgi:hypothetical protein
MPSTDPMSGFNLPPGCNVSDIPGNRPEDGVEERLLELFAEAFGYGFDEEQIVTLWRAGVEDEQRRLAEEQRET